MSDLELSVSSMSRDAGCKRAFALSMRAGLRRHGANYNLALGTAFHKYAAIFYAEGNEIKAQKEAGKAFKDSVPDDIDPVKEEEGAELLHNICVQYPHLSAVYDTNDSLQTLGVENNFRVPIGQAYLIGRIDWFGLARMMQSIMDHKTARSAQASYFYDYNIDPQAILYPFAARELKFDVRQFGVNVVAKTKVPYVTREWYPIDWRHVDWAADQLKRTIDEWIRLPEDPGEILDAIPGNPCHCRKCIFNELCFFERSKTQLIVDNYFEIADHSDFKPSGDEE